MTTERPRIQAYLDPELHKHFLEWKRELGIAKDSEALNVLLAEYFGVSFQSPSITTDQIEEMIEETIQPRFAEMINEFNVFRVEFKNEVWFQLKKEFAIWNESLQSCVQALKHRLEALEASELPSELPSEFLEDKLQSAQVVTPEEKECSESQGNLLNDSLDDRRSPDPAPGDLEAPGLEDDDIGDIAPENAEPIEVQATQLTVSGKEEYSESPSDSPGNLPEFLNAANLARRLGISKSVISRRKCDSTFEEWSKGNDPAGIGWRFPGEGQRFFPVCVKMNLD